MKRCSIYSPFFLLVTMIFVHPKNSRESSIIVMLEVDFTTNVQDFSCALLRFSNAQFHDLCPCVRKLLS